MQNQDLHQHEVVYVAAITRVPATRSHPDDAGVAGTYRVDLKAPLATHAAASAAMGAFLAQTPIRQLDGYTIACFDIAGNAIGAHGHGQRHTGTDFVRAITRADTENGAVTDFVSALKGFAA